MTPNPDPGRDPSDPGDVSAAVRHLARGISTAHRNIAVLGVFVLLGFAVIGIGVSINGSNAVQASNAADTANDNIVTAKTDASRAARKEAVKVAKRNLVIVRRQTRRETVTIVKRELGRRGAQGFRGRPPTAQEVDAAVRRAGVGSPPTAVEVRNALLVCLANGGCGALRGPAGADGKDGRDGKEADPITPEMIDAAVARRCAMGGCGSPGPQGATGKNGADGAPGPPPMPATIQFVDPVTGTTYTCVIDFTVGPGQTQPCTAAGPLEARR